MALIMMIIAIFREDIDSEPWLSKLKPAVYYNQKLDECEMIDEHRFFPYAPTSMIIPFVYWDGVSSPDKMFL